MKISYKTKVRNKKQRKISLTIKRNNILEESGFGVTYLKSGFGDNPIGRWVTIYLIFFKIKFHCFSIEWRGMK